MCEAGLFQRLFVEPETPSLKMHYFLLSGQILYFENFRDYPRRSYDSLREKRFLEERWQQSTVASQIKMSLESAKRSTEQTMNWISQLHQSVDTVLGNFGDALVQLGNLAKQHREVDKFREAVLTARRAGIGFQKCSEQLQGDLHQLLSHLQELLQKRATASELLETIQTLQIVLHFVSASKFDKYFQFFKQKCQDALEEGYELLEQGKTAVQSPKLNVANPTNLYLNEARTEILDWLKSAAKELGKLGIIETVEARAPALDNPLARSTARLRAGLADLWFGCNRELKFTEELTWSIKVSLQEIHRLCQLAADAKLSEIDSILVQFPGNFDAEADYQRVNVRVDGRTALHCCAAASVHEVSVGRPEHAEFAMALLARNADIGIADKDRRLPLHLAVMSLSSKLVRLLLGRSSHERHVSARDKTSWTPLMYAAAQDCTRSAKMLLESIRQRIARKEPSAEEEAADAMVLAAQKHNFGVFKLVAKSGIELNRRSSLFGMSALEAVAKMGPFQTWLRLYKRLATDDAARAVKKLCKLSSKGDPKKLEDFLKATLPKNEEDLHVDWNPAKRRCGLFGNRTALLCAAAASTHSYVEGACGHAECARILIWHGANVNERDDDCDSALHLAVKSTNVELMEVLLGADNIAVDALDSEYRTPLMLAACFDYHEQVPLLLSKGADTGAVDKYGDSAAKIAEQNGCESALKVLREFQASCCLKRQGSSESNASALTGEPEVNEESSDAPHFKNVPQLEQQASSSSRETVPHSEPQEVSDGVKEPEREVASCYNGMPKPPIKSEQPEGAGADQLGESSGSGQEMIEQGNGEVAHCSAEIEEQSPQGPAETGGASGRRNRSSRCRVL